MGKALLTVRLAARDLRHRAGQAALLLLAITAATSVLTLGLVLHGVTSQPYQQTRAATHGRTWLPSSATRETGRTVRDRRTGRWSRRRPGR